MVPKTKLQKEVFKLSKKLPDLTPKQRDWAIRQCYDARYFARLKTKNYCLHCGHTWNDKADLVFKIAGAICPSCHSDLKLLEHYKRSYKEFAYWAILTTIRGMQVIRYFYVEINFKKQLEPTFFISEVVQIWITSTGRSVVRSKNFFAFGYEYNWNFSSDLETRSKHYSTTRRYNIVPYKVYPLKRILPVIKRNGFTGDLHEYSYQDFFTLILSNSIAETLLKSNQIALFKSLLFHKNISTYWPSIKICIRNNYTIKETMTWMDYIDLLIYFHKDIHSPKYVCPKNLKKEHDRYVAKKQIILDRQEKERLKAQMEKDQVAFLEQKSRFLDLSFQKNNLVVEPLRSVEEFFDEGKSMHHCVFRYYSKEDVLVLSAKVNGERKETVSVSLNNFKISQSVGACNKITDYHDQIVSLVTENMKEIRKKAKEKIYAT